MNNCKNACDSEAIYLKEFINNNDNLKLIMKTKKNLHRFYQIWKK